MREIINLVIILNLFGILIISTISLTGYIPDMNREYSRLYSSGEFLYYDIEKEQRELEILHERAKNGEDVIDEISNKTSKILDEKNEFNRLDKRLSQIVNYKNWLYTSSIILVILLIDVVVLFRYKNRFVQS